MAQNIVFQDRDPKKRPLTKDIIGASMFKETRFFLIQRLVLLFFILIIDSILVTVAIRHPGIETILFSILLTALVIFIVCLTIRDVKEARAWSRGEFSVRQDRLINIKPHEHTWKTRTDGVYHQEDVFFFEGGTKFVHTRISSAQKNLTYSAHCGDIFYLVFLNRQPNKPKYIYNSQEFEYQE
jgi:hypothetical protein